MSRNNRRSVLRSRFGPYGGRYVPEMLVPALEELESAYLTFRKDREFLREWNLLLKRYVGRPTPLYFAENLTRSGGGARIYLKLEGLAHTGAHKINNVLGQVLLARRMGKRRIVAETGAGQHGLATAAACAKFGLPCTIFMGEHDMRRQQPNVFTMKLHGAEVVPVAEGTRTLKDAVNAAFKHWVENLAETHYLLGSALGPHPYPTIVRDFQSIIGREVKSQIREYEGRLPDMLVACVGGGSNAMGLFAPFLKDTGVACIGVEAGGRSSAAGEHAVRFGADGKTGIVQGYKSIFLQDGDGQILPTHSVSAGLDYAGVGPQIAHLHDTGRISLVSATDEEALGGLKRLAEEEGILPALESSHAAAYALKKAAACAETDIMVINISGRGEKDLFITARALDRDGWLEFLKRETERD